MHIMLCEERFMKHIHVCTCESVWICETKHAIDVEMHTHLQMVQGLLQLHFLSIKLQLQTDIARCRSVVILKHA